MRILIEPDGSATAIYGEAIDLTKLGEVAIRRASTVEPDERGRWWVDLSPVGGPTLGPYLRRSVAIASEVRWLEDNHLNSKEIPCKHPPHPHDHPDKVPAPEPTAAPGPDPDRPAP